MVAAPLSCVYSQVPYWYSVTVLSCAASSRTVSCVFPYFLYLHVLPPGVQCWRYLAVSLPYALCLWKGCAGHIAAIYCMSYIISGDGPVLCKSQNSSYSCHYIKCKQLWSYLFFLFLYFAVDFQVLARAVVVLS